MIALAVLAAGLRWGVSSAEEIFNIVSTDDAFVNSHVTVVAPRVEDNVVEVLVDDGYFVQPGTPLVKLDPEPYQIAVDQKQAALEVARSELEQTMAKVRSQEAEARAAWYGLLGSQNQVQAQLAALRSNLADLHLAQANLEYAQREYQRVSGLTGGGAATREELQERRTGLRVAEARVTAAREALQQTRANLGLPPNEENPLDVPKDLDQTFPAVQVALSNEAVALAQIGVPLRLYKLTQEQVHQQLVDMTPEKDINKASFLPAAFC